MSDLFQVTYPVQGPGQGFVDWNGRHLVQLAVKAWEGREARLLRDLENKRGDIFRKDEIVIIRSSYRNRLSLRAKRENRGRFIRCVRPGAVKLIEDPVQAIETVLIAYLKANPWSTAKSVSAHLEVSFGQYRGIIKAHMDHATSGRIQRRPGPDGYEYAHADANPTRTALERVFLGQHP